MRPTPFKSEIRMSKTERNPTSLLIAICMFVMISLSGLGAEPGLVNPPAKPLETNGQETVRSYLLLQEQLHATQLAIERNRQEAEEAQVESAKALAVRLQSIEQALAAQRSQELQH